MPIHYGSERQRVSIRYFLVRSSAIGDDLSRSIKSNDYIYVYKDGGTDNLLQLAGGDFAFLPLIADDTLKAWATTSGTIVEWMVIGTDQ